MTTATAHPTDQPKTRSFELHVRVAGGRVFLVHPEQESMEFTLEELTALLRGMVNGTDRQAVSA